MIEKSNLIIAIKGGILITAFLLLCAVVPPLQIALTLFYPAPFYFIGMRYGATTLAVCGAFVCLLQLHIPIVFLYTLFVAYLPALILCYFDLSLEKNKSSTIKLEIHQKSIRYGHSLRNGHTINLLTLLFICVYCGLFQFVSHDFKPLKEMIYQAAQASRPDVFINVDKIYLDNLLNILPGLTIALYFLLHLLNIKLVQSYLVMKNYYLVIDKRAGRMPLNIITDILFFLVIISLMFAQDKWTVFFKNASIILGVHFSVLLFISIFKLLKKTEYPLHVKIIIFAVVMFFYIMFVPALLFF